MNFKRILNVLTIILCFSILCVNASIKSQSKGDKKSVLDYFQIIYDGKFKVKLLDKRNGYMELIMDDPPTLTQVALFRVSKKYSLLVIFEESICSSISGCGNEIQTYGF